MERDAIMTNAVRPGSKSGTPMSGIPFPETAAAQIVPDPREIA